MNDIEWRGMTLDEKDRFLCNCDYIANIAIRSNTFAQQCIALNDKWDEDAGRRLELQRESSQRKRDREKGAR